MTAKWISSNFLQTETFNIWISYYVDRGQGKRYDYACQICELWTHSIAHLVAVHVGCAHANQWKCILTIFLCFLLVETTLSLTAALATPTMTPMAMPTPSPTLQPTDAYVIYLSVFVSVSVLLCGCIVCSIVCCCCALWIKYRRMRRNYMQG